MAEWAVPKCDPNYLTLSGVDQDSNFMWHLTTVRYLQNMTVPATALYIPILASRYEADFQTAM